MLNKKLLGLLTFFFFSFVVVVNLPYNPLEPNSKKLKLLTKLLIPQGWGFFTRDPREESLQYYVIHNEKLHYEKDLRQSESSNLFGLSREARKENYIYSTIATSISKNEMRDHTGISVQEIIIDSFVTRVHSDFDSTSYMLITLVKPIPWAWAATNLNNVTRNFKYVFVEVCPY